MCPHNQPPRVCRKRILQAPPRGQGGEAPIILCQMLQKPWRKETDFGFLFRDLVRQQPPQRVQQPLAQDRLSQARMSPCSTALP